ncbi:MAG: beta-propeller fold lactonase family protein [Plectolyngbya sp. WJT66-NPBG17]|jgi:YVTN family beta-propeller protein|nr:beta-propeller fold lactonase family protein [Plectolyngbya sp. WJT66-NPBG17]
MRQRVIIAFVLVLLLSIAIPTLAGQASLGVSERNIPISSHDRVYSADQYSNTVSVHNPETNQLLGVIHLGQTLPGNLSPLYKGQLLVHGMGFAPDHRTLDVVSIASNSVAFIDTQTNQVKHITYVGRSPHEAFFTPDGKEVWVAVRGEDYVSVLDGQTYKEKLQIPVGNGPGMTIFRPDGKYGFVCSSFTPETKVIDVATHRIVATVPQASPFCPNIAVTPDGKQVWFTLKDIGKTQLFSAEPPFNVINTLDTGPITNHVNFVRNQNGQFAYITIGGENVVKVYTTTSTPQLVATIPVGDLPHGLWPSGEGTRIYVALENGTGMVAIDTLTNKVIARNPSGQSSQALVYIPNAVPQGDGLANLQPLGDSGLAAHLIMGPPGSSPEQAATTVAVNNQGLIDIVEASVSGLQPEQSYELVLVEHPNLPYGKIEPLERFKTNQAGAAIVTTIGPIKQIVTATSETQRRYLAIVPTQNKDQRLPVQIQLERKVT